MIGSATLWSAEGNLPEALKSYQAGLAIRERLALADAGNSDWQRDLAVSNDRIGDALVRRGKFARGAEILSGGTCDCRTAGAGGRGQFGLAARSFGFE